jgi:hypothetical protein
MKYQLALTFLWIIFYQRILVNYQYYGNETLLELINKVNSTHEIDEAQMNLLKCRLKCSPFLYGVNFLSNILAEKIDQLCDNCNKISFQSEATECLACESFLESKNIIK